MRREVREQYIVVDQKAMTYIGMSPSLMGAKKISGMHPRKNQDGTVYYGAIYKASEISTTPRSDRIDVDPHADPIAERVCIEGRWGWTDTGASLPYKYQSAETRAVRRASVKAYLADKIVIKVCLPKEVHRAIKEMQPVSIQQYVLGLIIADLRERGYYHD